MHNMDISCVHFLPQYSFCRFYRNHISRDCRDLIFDLQPSLTPIDQLPPSPEAMGDKTADKRNDTNLRLKFQVPGFTSTPSYIFSSWLLLFPSTSPPCLKQPCCRPP